MMCFTVLSRSRHSIKRRDCISPATNHNLRAGMVQDVNDPVGRFVEIDRHVGGAKPEDGKIRDVPFRSVGREQALRDRLVLTPSCSSALESPAMRLRNSADDIGSHLPLTRSDRARSWGIRSTTFSSFSVSVAKAMVKQNITARFSVRAMELHQPALPEGPVGK